MSVTIEPEGIRLHRADGSSLLWPIADVRQSHGTFGGNLIRIEYGTDPVQALFVDHPGFVAAVRRVHPRSGLRVRASTGRILALGTGVILAAVLLYVFGANTAADWAARRAPLKWEAALGSGVAERMAPAAKRCLDSTSVADVRDVLDRLLRAASASPYTFELAIVRDSAINAFAAPGGFVAVHSGLIAAAASPDELAGVLAHEVQHVLLRHSTRAIFREVPLQLAIALLVGGTGFEGVASMAGSLGVLSYRREDEAEADREGMRLMHAAGLDGRAMVSFMQTLGRKDADAPRLVSYLSSHPHTADRVAALERMANTGRPATTSPAMDAARWAHVQRVCGASGASLPSAP